MDILTLTMVKDGQRWSKMVLDGILMEIMVDNSEIWWNLSASVTVMVYIHWRTVTTNLARSSKSPFEHLKGAPYLTQPGDIHPIQSNPLHHGATMLHPSVDVLFLFWQCIVHIKQHQQLHSIKTEQIQARHASRAKALPWLIYWH